MNRITRRVTSGIACIMVMAIDEPAFGRQQVFNELREERLSISPVGVRCVWMRHDLETFKKRLKAL